MKSILTALIIIFSLLSCQKEVVQTPENDVIKTASRVIGPEDQPEPVWVTITTVVMHSSYTYDFTFNWKIGLNLGHGGGSYVLGSPHSGVSGGGTVHGWQQDIVYWNNQPGTHVITFMIKAKHSYYALMSNTIEHVQDDMYLDGWYDVVTKGHSLTPHIIGSHFIK